MKRSDLRIHLNNLEKEEQIELQESTRIIMKIRTKGNKLDQKEQNKTNKHHSREVFFCKGQMVNILNFVSHMLQLLLSVTGTQSRRSHYKMNGHSCVSTKLHLQNR